MTAFDKLPDTALIRQNQLVPNPNPAKREGQAPLLDVSASTFWRLIASGDFPAPLKLGKNITAWRVGDVRKWLATKNGQEISADRQLADTAFAKLVGVLALHAHTLTRSNPADGAVVYFVSHQGVTRALQDIAAVNDFAKRVGASRNA